MTENQFQVLRSLYAAVGSVGDAFGSEATSSGLVMPTRKPSLFDACREFFPERWTVQTLGFEGFVANYAKPADDPAIHAFVTLARHLKADAAYLAPGRFDPLAHSRGAFMLGVYLDSMEEAGTRFLIAFDRVET